MNKIYLTLLALFAALGVNAATYTVYYHNTGNSGTVKAHVFDDNNTNGTNFSTTWPGKDATEYVGTSMYKYSYDYNGTLKNPGIIWTGKDSSKISGDADCKFENGAVYDTTGKTNYTIENMWQLQFNNGSWQNMTRKSDGVYEGTVNVTSQQQTIGFRLAGTRYGNSSGGDWWIPGADGIYSYTLAQNSNTSKFAKDNDNSIFGEWTVTITIDSGKWKVTFTKGGGSSNVDYTCPATLYMLGTPAGSWAPSNTLSSTKSGNTFTFANIQLNKDATFSFANMAGEGTGDTAWNNFNNKANLQRYGASSGDTEVSSTATMKVFAGANSNGGYPSAAGSYKFTGNSGKYDVVVNFDDPEKPTLTIKEAQSDKWYYQINSDDKKQFTSSFSTGVIDANTTIAIFKNDTQYSNGTTSDVTVDLSGQNATAITANSYKYVAQVKGTYYFTLTDATTAPKIAISVTEYVAPDPNAKGDWYFSVNDGEYLPVTTKAVVYGEDGNPTYTQWQVTQTFNNASGKSDYWIKFRKDSKDGDQYEVDNGQDLGKKGHLFQNFFKANNNKNFYGSGNGATYTFIIRQMAGSTSYSIAVKYVNQTESDYVAMGTENNAYPTSFNMNHDMVDLAAGKPGAMFKVSTSYEIGGGTHTTGQNITASAENPTSHNMAYHWTKYEHPFWQGNSIQTMKPTSGAAADQDCGKVLYYSDTYLHADDPRAVYHFGNSIYRQYHLDGKRSHAVNRNAGATHNCRNFSNAYYRVYVTLDGEHGAIENPVTTNAAKPAANGIGIRAAVTADNSKGTRIAYTAMVPDNTTGIDDIIADEEADLNAPAVYFNLQGVQIANPEAGQVYIVRRGTTTTKELYR